MNELVQKYLEMIIFKNIQEENLLFHESICYCIDTLIQSHFNLISSLIPFLFTHLFSIYSLYDPNQCSISIPHSIVFNTCTSILSSILNQLKASNHFHTIFQILSEHIHGYLSCHMNSVRKTIYNHIIPFFFNQQYYVYIPTYLVIQNDFIHTIFTLYESNDIEIKQNALELLSILLDHSLDLYKQQSIQELIRNAIIHKDTVIAKYAFQCLKQILNLYFIHFNDYIIDTSIKDIQPYKKYYQQQWNLFISIYETLEEFASHLIKSVWNTVKYLQYITPLKDIQDISTVINQQTFFILNSEWIEILYKKGFLSRNPQISLLVLQDLLSLNLKTSIFIPSTSFMLYTFIPFLSNAAFYRGNDFGLGYEITSFFLHYIDCLPKDKQPEFIQQLFVQIITVINTPLALRFLFAIFIPSFYPSSLSIDMNMMKFEGNNEINNRIQSWNNNNHLINNNLVNHNKSNSSYINNITNNSNNRICSLEIPAIHIFDLHTLLTIPTFFSNTLFKSLSTSGHQDIYKGLLLTILKYTHSINTNELIDYIRVLNGFPMSLLSEYKTELIDWMNKILPPSDSLHTLLYNEFYNYIHTENSIEQLSKYLILLLILYPSYYQDFINEFIIKSLHSIFSSSSSSSSSSSNTTITTTTMNNNNKNISPFLINVLYLYATLLSFSNQMNLTIDSMNVNLYNISYSLYSYFIEHFESFINTDISQQFMTIFELFNTFNHDYIYISKDLIYKLLTRVWNILSNPIDGTKIHIPNLFHSLYLCIYNLSLSPIEDKTIQSIIQSIFTFVIHEQDLFKRNIIKNIPNGWNNNQYINSIQTDRWKIIDIILSSSFSIQDHLSIELSYIQSLYDLFMNSYDTLGIEYTLSLLNVLYHVIPLLILNNNQLNLDLSVFFTALEHVYKCMTPSYINISKYISIILQPELFKVIPNQSFLSLIHVLYAHATTGSYKECYTFTIYLIHCLHIHPEIAIYYIDILSELLLYTEVDETAHKIIIDAEECIRMVLLMWIDSLDYIDIQSNQQVYLFIKELILLLLKMNLKDEWNSRFVKDGELNYKKIKCWQALCLLSKYIDINMMSDINIYIWKCIDLQNLLDVRKYVEMFTYIIVSKFPEETISKYILPRLSEVNLANQILTSYILVCGCVIIRRKLLYNDKIMNNSFENDPIYKYIEPLCISIYPYITSTEGLLRTTAQYILYMLLDTILFQEYHAKKSIPEPCSINDKDIYLYSIYYILRQNKRLISMRDRCHKWFIDMEDIHIYNYKDILSYINILNKEGLVEVYMEQIKKEIDELYLEWYEEDKGERKINKIEQHIDIYQENTNEDMLSTFQKKILPWETHEKHGENAKQELIVIASYVDKVPNLGGLARTCEIYQASKLIINDKKIMNDPIFINTSVTANQWVDIEEVKQNDVYNYIIELKKNGYTIVALEQTISSISLESYHFPPRVALVLGREKEGVPQEILKVVDDCVEIPQLGIIRSLNVHVSASILIWEYISLQFIILFYISILYYSIII
ncbi:hypothetical protein WA158_007510 [Blastocystis sp. Blastoise]